MYKYLDLYKAFIFQNLKVMLEYKNDFIIGFFATLLTQFCGIFFVWILFENIKQIHGWTFYQITFIYGFLTIAKALNMIFFYNLYDLGWNYVREGKFDIILIRPVSALFQILADKIQQEGFAYLMIGILILGKSISMLSLKFSGLDIVLLIIGIICGGLILAAIDLIAATATFWTVNSHVIMNSFSSLQEFALYPIVIYPKFISFILTWLIPYAFASFYPANYFLHKGYQGYALLTPIIATILWIIALRIWGIGVKNYSSTGS